MPLEAWLRGPVDGVVPMLVPVAHMLQHAHEDGVEALRALTPDQIWTRPAGGASVGFHISHLIGALDRLFTYARGQALTADQLHASTREDDSGDPPADAAALTAALAAATARAIDQLRATDPARCSNHVEWGGGMRRRRCWDCWCMEANIPRGTRDRRLR